MEFHKENLVLIKITHNARDKTDLQFMKELDIYKASANIIPTSHPTHRWKITAGPTTYICTRSSYYTEEDALKVTEWIEKRNV